MDYKYLDDQTLLSCILRTTSGGTCPHTQAKHILDKFGDLASLQKASTAELREVQGITLKKAEAIQAAFELGRRFIQTPIHRGKRITSSMSVYESFHPYMKNQEQETFWTLLLNQKNQVVRKVMIAQGSHNFCTMSAVDIFSPAVRERVGKMILVHNHPSGSPEPSMEDRELTRKVCDMAQTLRINIIDHIIVGDDSYVSFADRGYL